MFPVLTVSQMRKIDQEAIGGDPAVGFSYMQTAAGGIADAARRLLPSPASHTVTIVCGKGNNGGDGYAAGSLLLDAGYETMCLALCDPDTISGEARMAYEQYTAREGKLRRPRDVSELELGQCSLVIDAILGSGLHGNPRGLAAEAISAINKCAAPILAVDTPSGLDNDTGQPGGPCVKADVTVAMGYPKIGTCFFPGRSHVGSLIIKDLNYPSRVVARHHSNVFLPSVQSLRPILPGRKPSGSKFDHGLVLMVCGSRGMLGSATLASMAALRSGCGMVHAAVPSCCMDVLSGKLTEVVLHPVEGTKEGSPSEAALENILALSSRMQCTCIGPGLSHHPETSRLVQELVALLDTPIVLDADGINAYRGAADLLAKHHSGLLMTPHAGEWQRLFGPLPPNPSESIQELKRRAAELNMTILYKGSPSMVVDQKGKAYVLPVGNSGMATAGSGDVLCGIVSALVAQGATLPDAALLGAHIHGEAGNAAAENRDVYSLVASDIIDNLHHPFRALAKERQPRCGFGLP